MQAEQARPTTTDSWTSRLEMYPKLTIQVKTARFVLATSSVKNPKCS